MKVRFREWLRPPARMANAQAYADSPLHLESACLAAGTFIRGIAPDLLTGRLATPPLRMAVPLTATYWSSTSADTATPRRQLSGNMLVFDEAIRRTDDLAAVGGIGDIIEVDLLASRGFKGLSLDKIGANPVFHGPPGAPDTARVRQLAPLAPFGLSYDQSDNSLVAQTGIIVVPTGGSGEWLLAEVRTRRMILPEVLLGTELFDTVTPDDPARTRSFRIPLRTEGEHFVPLDFCIDVKANSALTELALFRRADEAGPPIELQPGPAAGYRLLVSWHKARYDRADKPSWRAQVLTQVRIQGQLEWKRIGKLTCEQTGFDWLQTTAGGMLLLAADAAFEKVSIVPMSDYTAGLWLSFIGNFAATPVEPADLVFRRGASNRLTLETRPGRAPTPPECIALSAEATDKAVEFHWLLVYRPLRDVTRSDVDSDAGALLGAWRYDTNGYFEPLDSGNQAADLGGCYAYLCTFHRITALNTDEREVIAALEKPGEGRTQGLIECMFPSQSGGVRESTIRMVPKVLGQIAIS